MSATKIASGVSMRSFDGDAGCRHEKLPVQSGDWRSRVESVKVAKAASGAFYSGSNAFAKTKNLGGERRSSIVRFDLCGRRLRAAHFAAAAVAKAAVSSGLQSKAAIKNDHAILKSAVNIKRSKICFCRRLSFHFISSRNVSTNPFRSQHKMEGSRQRERRDSQKKKAYGGKRVFSHSFRRDVEFQTMSRAASKHVVALGAPR